jgi:hypothetical protein
MILNRKVISIIILSLLAHPAYADYRLDSNREYSIKIPKDDIVSIKVKGDRISQVFAKSNYFSLENDPKSGTLFLTNLSDKPYSLSFITEQGREQSLHLMPMNRGYTQRVCFTLEEQNVQPHNKLIIEDTMKKISLAKRLGFHSLTGPILRHDKFTVKSIGYRNFKELRVRKYEVANWRQRSTVKFRPQDFSFNYEVVMVMLEHDSLLPGEKTQLYTVARR